MKNLVLLTLTILLASQISVAQQPKYAWANTSGDRDLDTDNSGFIYTLGFFYDSMSINGQKIIGKGNADIIITKSDTFGRVIWTKTYGYTKNDYASDIEIDNKNNIYITGLYDSATVLGNDTLISNGKRDVYYAKLDTAGSILWAKSIGTAGDENGFCRIATDKWNNFYLTTTLGASVSGRKDTLLFNSQSFPIQQTDLFILRYNANGNLVFINQETSTRNFLSCSIKVDSSGNIYTTGGYSGIANFDTITVTNNNLDVHLYVAKYDSLGNLLHLTTHNTGSGSSTAADIEIGRSGHVYVVVSLYSFTLIAGNYTLKSPNGAGSSTALIKYDDTGNVIWGKWLGGNMGLSTIKLDSYEDIYFSNTYRWLNGYITLGKYDSSGALIWSNEKGPHQDPPEVYGIAISITNCVYLTGHYASSSNIFGRDTLTYKDGIGFMTKILTHAVVLPPPINIPYTSEIENIHLYPNPTNDYVILSGDKLSTYRSYSIYNLTGQVVNKGLLHMQNKMHVSVSHLPDGEYILRLNSTNDTKAIHFIKKH